MEYIDDIHTEDRKYNFTDGVGTMSTAVRDSVSCHRRATIDCVLLFFSANRSTLIDNFQLFKFVMVVAKVSYLSILI